MISAVGSLVKKILWTNRKFSSRYVRQDVRVLFAGCLTGVALVFDSRADRSGVRVWTSQLTWVHSKVASCIARHFYHV